jgi:5-formyltetrahydrofolate cyclo-ligase
MSAGAPAHPSSPARARREALRASARACRAALDPAARQAAGEAMACHAAALAPLRTAARVAVYLALPHEAPTAPLIARLRAAGAALLIPARDAREGRYRWAELPARADELRPGDFGVLEPASPCWADDAAPQAVITPGVVFDRRGGRLGHGAGHYDRLLARCPHAARIGFAFHCQIVDQVPHEPHDEPMDFLVTEQGADPTGARPTFFSIRMNEQKP